MVTVADGFTSPHIYRFPADGPGLILARWIQARL
jgi:hypothetical protein